MLATANFGEHDMPRYFFNVVQAGHVYRDDTGQEFASESAALEEARLVAGEPVLRWRKLDEFYLGHSSPTISRGRFRASASSATAFDRALPRRRSRLTIICIAPQPLPPTATHVALVCPCRARGVVAGFDRGRSGLNVTWLRWTTSMWCNAWMCCCPRTARE